MTVPQSAKTGPNTVAFLRDQSRYFTGSYERFCAFGGPCVYFHTECLSAGRASFLSDRHLEMLYATLASWGMHRMGESDTKMTAWDVFRDSLRGCRDLIQPFKGMDFLGLSEDEYRDAVSALALCYHRLRVSTSSATIVANSKALFHLLPSLIPPVDRQYTVRFFRHLPEEWRDSKGKFKTIMLPSNAETQFDLFASICAGVKQLADGVDPTLLKAELDRHGVPGPKALDNAIVNFVHLNSGPVREVTFSEAG